MKLLSSVFVSDRDTHLKRVGLFATAAFGFGAYFGSWASAIGLGLLLVLAVFEVYGNWTERLVTVLLGLEFSLFFFWIFGGSLVFSIILNWDSFEGAFKDLKKLRYFLIPGAVLVFGSLWLRLRECPSRVILFFGCALLFSAVLSTISGLAGLFFGWNPLRFGNQVDPLRAGGIYGMVLTYSYSMQFTFLLIIGGVFNFRRLSRFIQINQKWLFGILIFSGFITGIGIYFSYSRGAVLGVATGVFILILVRRMWKFLCIFAVGVGGIVILLNSPVIRSSMGDSVANSEDFSVSHLFGARYFQDMSANNAERLSQWKTSALVFMERPLLGIGYRQFERTTDEIKIRFGLPKDHYDVVDGEPIWMYYKAHSHNNYLEAFAAGGVVCGIAFLLFGVFWLIEVWRTPLVNEFFAPVVVAFLVSGFFENTFYDSEVVTYIVVLYSISILWIRKSREGAYSSA